MRPIDVAYRLLKTDIRFGEQDEDDPNISHIDLTHHSMKDNRELPYTDDPVPFQQNANAGNRLVGYYDEDSPYYGYYDDMETTPEAERASYERELDGLDEKSQRKLIQELMNADVNNAMWSAHGINQNIPSMDEDEKDKLIEAAREQVKPGKLYSHDDWYKDSPLIDGEIRGPHWFYPSDRAMARNLNPEWYDAKWIDGQFNPLALAPLDQKFRMPGREGEWSIQELADEMKNASEPFEIAYRLLKMPIVPDSIQTKDEDGVMSLHGQFLDDSHDDPEQHETMPIFADWTKPVTLPNDGTEPLDYATLGDIDIGIGSPGEEHKRTDNTERRGKFQLAQLPTGSYIPGPSTHDVAIEVPPEHRQKGYSKAMIEMLGNLLQHKDARGQIGINPFQDGFTGLGYNMMRGVLQNEQMAQMLRQHFISQIPTNPMMIDNLNAMNHMISGSRNDFSRAVDQDSLRDDEDSIERDIYRTREGRGDGEVA